MVQIKDDTYLSDLMGEANEVMQQYNFGDEKVIDFVYAIIREATNQDKKLNIAADADAQIVIYTENEPDNFRNLAIDEDGDVSYMFFAKDKKQSERKMYYFEDAIDVTLVSLL